MPLANPGDLSVVFAGGFLFPEGDAGAARVTGLGLALRDAGVKVSYAGQELGGRDEDQDRSGQFSYLGMTYYPQEPMPAGVTSRVRRLTRYLLTSRYTIRRIEAMRHSGRRVVVAYNAPAALLHGLRRFCWRHGFGLVCDVPEWFEPRHVPLGRFGPFRWDSELRMRYYHPRVGRLVVISEYLARYYRGRGASVLRVPPLVDCTDPKWKGGEEDDPTRGELLLGYAGTPGKKDVLLPVLEALRALRNSSPRLKLVLIGPDEQALVRALGGNGDIVRELGEALRITGRVSHREALRLVASTDFTVLFRPNQRYANAGFPTKLVESLALGVPVLCNPTSDIASYVHDGVEGLFAKDCSTEGCLAVMRRAQKLTVAERLAMRNHALRQARASFDYRTYSPALSAFIAQSLPENVGSPERGGDPCA